MKFKILLFSVFLMPFISRGQTTIPDTLQLETRTGEKILLIGNDLNKFKTINADSMIRKALISVKDSLAIKKEREEWDSLTKEQKIAKRKASLEALHSDKTKYSRNLKGHGVFRPIGNVGLGTVRSAISPMLEAGITFAPQRQDFYYLNYPEYSFFKLTASTVFIFKDPDVQRKSMNNTFVNVSLGNKTNTSLKSSALISEFEFGLGYIVQRTGNYFGKNTIRLFGSVMGRSRFFRIGPEIYVSDFKEVIPGLTIKVF